MNYQLIAMQDQSLRQAFGKRLKELRKQKGWTQKKLANQLEIRYSHLNKYENGMHVPPLEKLIQLAEIFDISLDHLVMGLPIADTPIRNESLHKRFKTLESFDDEDKQTVIQVRERHACATFGEVDPVGRDIRYLIGSPGHGITYCRHADS